MSSTFVIRDRDEIVKNVLFAAAMLTVFPLFTGLAGAWLAGFAIQLYGVVMVVVFAAGKPYELEISVRGADGASHVAQYHHRRA